ncbi:hypothetical protein ACWDAZ_35075, partial [Streptomyces sp. NPDC001215]
RDIWDSRSHEMAQQIVVGLYPAVQVSEETLACSNWSPASRVVAGAVWSCLPSLAAWTGTKRSASSPKTTTSSGCSSL